MGISGYSNDQIQSVLGELEHALFFSLDDTDPEKILAAISESREKFVGTVGEAFSQIIDFHFTRFSGRSLQARRKDLRLVDDVVFDFEKFHISSLQLKVLKEKAPPWWEKKRRKDKKEVFGPKMRQLAKKIGTNFGQRHAEFIIEHQNELPESFRGHRLGFPGTLWTNGRSQWIPWIGYDKEKEKWQLYFCDYYHFPFYIGDAFVSCERGTGAKESKH